MVVSIERVKCDIYLPEDVVSSQFRFLNIYDRGFVYQEGSICSGYLGVDVDRVKIVRFISALQSEGYKGFSVPVCYRDGLILNRESCFSLAEEYASSQGYGVTFNHRLDDGCPLYSTFTIINDPLERSGGIVRVDRFDGHIWSFLEFEEYMHDYNGVLVWALELKQEAARLVESGLTLVLWLDFQESSQVMGMDHTVLTSVQ